MSLHLNTYSTVTNAPWHGGVWAHREGGVVRHCPEHDAEVRLALGPRYVDDSVAHRGALHLPRNATQSKGPLYTVLKLSNRKRNFRIQKQY